MKRLLSILITVILLFSSSSYAADNLISAASQFDASMQMECDGHKGNADCTAHEDMNHDCPATSICGISVFTFSPIHLSFLQRNAKTIILPPIIDYQSIIL